MKSPAGNKNTVNTHTSKHSRYTSRLIRARVFQRSTESHLNTTKANLAPSQTTALSNFFLGHPHRQVTRSHRAPIVSHAGGNTDSSHDDLI